MPFVLLLVLALVLPFESATPLFALGPVGITSTELALYAVLAAWGLQRVADPRGLRLTAVHWAVLAWTAALLLSGARAQVEGAAALKFALRGASGCALAFAAAELVSTQTRLTRLTFALLAGAIVSALMALLSGATAVAAPNALPRASGSFAYPNIGSMFWEATLPLALTLGPWAPLPGLILLAAILSTASRAGLAVAGLTLLAWSIVDVGACRRAAIPVLGGLGVVLATAWFVHPDWFGRMTEGETAWYRADYRTDARTLELAAGAIAALEVEVRNTGTQPWSSTGEHAISIGCQWRDGNGRPLLESLPVPLPKDLGVGDAIHFAVPVRAPDLPGSYRLRWQLVMDGDTWLTPEDGSDELLARVGPGSGQAQNHPPPRPVQRQPTRTELWRAGLQMWAEHPWLGVGPDNFRRLYSPQLGPHTFDNRVHANSLYVETLADLGLAGALALLGLMAALWRSARAGWLAARPADRLGVFGLLTALATFFVHGSVDYFLAFTPTLGLFWLLVGLAARPLEPEAR